MPKAHRPKRGSMQYWPRKRAKRPYARIRSWLKLDSTKLLAFIGYKVGMKHVMARDNTSNSLTKNQTISIPTTIIECPPLKPLSLRFYQQTDSGLKVISEILAPKLNKELKRKTKVSKKKQEIPKEFDDIKLVVYTQPKLTTIGKKKPDILEIAISGPKDKKLEYAKQFLEKEIKVNDVFKEAQYLDIHSLTKGKGFQGAVKRRGVAIRQHKSEKTKRGTGNLGAWHPSKVQYTIPQAGKMGYHQRTEFNKLILKYSSDPKEINLKSGFKHYGIIKNDYLLIKGSIAGSTKRTIILTEPMRSKKSLPSYEILK